MLFALVDFAVAGIVVAVVVAGIVVAVVVALVVAFELVKSPEVAVDW